MDYLKSLFKSKADYSRLAIASIAAFLAVFNHHGGDVDELYRKYAGYVGTATMIWALVTRSPNDD